MFNAMEELMRLHPASHDGRREHRPSDVEIFAELESRHQRPCQGDELIAANRPGEFLFSLPLP